MDLLVRVFQSDDIEVSLCWVKIIPEEARSILKKLKFVRDAKTRDSDFSYAAFESLLPEFYTKMDLCDAGLDEDLLADASVEECRILTEEEALLAGVAIITDTDTQKIVVWPGHVSWTAWTEDPMVEVETSSIPEKLIEDIAHQDPRHLMKTIAFNPEV